MEATDKSGKEKFISEMELNQPQMELVRQDIKMDLAVQGADIIRKNMAERRKGHEMGMMMQGQSKNCKR